MIASKQSKMVNYCNKNQAKMGKPRNKKNIYMVLERCLVVERAAKGINLHVRRHTSYLKPLLLTTEMVPAVASASRALKYAPGFEHIRNCID